MQTGVSYIGLLLAFTVSAAVAQEPLTLDQTLQAVLDRHQSLQVAELRLERARQEQARVESQLSWILGGQVGANRDTSIIGEPTDRSDIGASLKRQLESGSSVGVNAEYAHEDSAQTFTPLIPNPVDITTVDLSWRKPLGRGANNPGYKLDLVNAQTGAEIAEADRNRIRDDLARQTYDLFYAAALTQEQIKNAERSIGRAKRLKKYIRDNARLGVAEEKDKLQAEAQLRSREADLRRLFVTWKQQRTSLNRLMGRDWAAEFVPVLEESFAPMSEAFAQLLEEVNQNSADLRKNRAQIQIAEASIIRARDTHKDNLDVVFSVGNRTRSGKSSLGNISDSDVVGGVRLEYTRALDKRGASAEIYQAQLDRDIAVEEIRRIEDDLRYRLSSLLTEIDAARTALDSHRKSLGSEQKKLTEAIRRYRTGRTDTDQLIQFEGDLSAAELALERQNIEFARRHTELALLRGSLWQLLTYSRSVAPRAAHSEGDAQ